MIQIDEVLKKHGVGITELANRLGVDRQTVYYYIKQGDKNTVVTLKRIADAIGCDVSELFEQSEKDYINCPNCGAELKLEKK